MDNANLQAFNTALAVVGGMGLSLLLCVGAQKAFNANQAEQCRKPGIRDYHRLIEITSFLGDTKYCVHIRNLGTSVALMD